MCGCTSTFQNLYKSSVYAIAIGWAKLNLRMGMSRREEVRAINEWRQMNWYMWMDWEREGDADRVIVDTARFVHIYECVQFMLKSKWISCFENYLWIKNFWFSNRNWFKLFEFQYQHWMSNLCTNERTHARIYQLVDIIQCSIELTAMLFDMKWCAVEENQCHGWCCCDCMRMRLFIHIFWKYGWASFHSIVCSSMCHSPFPQSMNIKKATI